MTDSDLHGYWSDVHLYQGSMEGQWLAFLSDGFGWWEWANALAFESHRFRWQVRSPGTLKVRLLAYRSGTPHGRGGYSVKSQRHMNESHTTGYAIGPGLDAMDTTVTMLRLDEPQAFSRQSRYALMTRTVDPDRNPWSAKGPDRK